MSDYPRDPHEMRRAGYKKLSSSPATCRHCGRFGEWWQTTNGKNILFDPMPADNSRSERHVCPDPGYPEAAALRKQSPAAPVSPGVSTIEREIKRLRQATNARLIVLLNDDGAEVVAWRAGIPGEELRAELITVANHVRNAIQKESR